MPAEPSPARLEAFSDGVIAVIITIMVLEIKVPHQPGLAGFVTVVPTLSVYLLSFAFTGIYWVNHHHLVHRLRNVNHLILWTNLAFLFCLSLLPFFTNYMIEQHLGSFSVALYVASLLLTGIGFTALQRSIVGHLRRLPASEHDEQDAALQQAEQRKGILSLFLYLSAIPIAIYGRPALALAGIVTIIWILPTFGLRHPSVVHIRTRS